MTEFSQVPNSPSMDSLILSFNFITQLENLERVPNLTVLDLHNNKMDRLPHTVLSLSNMKTLNISNNDLSDIPPQISLMDNLVRIQVEGNPLKSIKSSMRTANAVQLKKYLRMRLGEDEEQKAEQQKAVA